MDGSHSLLHPLEQRRVGPSVLRAPRLLTCLGAFPQLFLVCELSALTQRELRQFTSKPQLLVSRNEFLGGDLRALPQLELGLLLTELELHFSCLPLTTADLLSDRLLGLEDEIRRSLSELRLGHSPRR